MINLPAIRRQILREEFYNYIWRGIALVEQINALLVERDSVDATLAVLISALSIPPEPSKAEIYRTAYELSCLDQFEMELKHQETER